MDIGIFQMKEAAATTDLSLRILTEMTTSELVVVKKIGKASQITPELVCS